MKFHNPLHANAYSSLVSSLQVVNQSIWRLYLCHNIDIVVPMLHFYANTNWNQMKNYFPLNGIRKTQNSTVIPHLIL